MKKSEKNTLPEGVKLLQTEGHSHISVVDKGMIAEPVQISLSHEKEKMEVSTGVGSRVMFYVDQKANTADITFHIGANSFVDVFFIESGKGQKQTTVSYHLKKHSSLNSWTFADAENLTMKQDVNFEEEHAFASLSGLSLLDDTCQERHLIHANHQAGHCVSRQFYKNVVSGSALSVFESLVTVAKGANKSDSKQLNKNLLLSRQARAISKPELKIESDDVACSHGSATGQLDEAAYFYLRSRGIDAKTSRFMMMDGFAKEIIDDVHDEPMKNQISKWATKKLEKMGHEAK